MIDPQPEPPLIMPFAKFYKGDYDEGERNLYIIWRGKRCMYVGISHDDIWVRWFHRNKRHIDIESDLIWHGQTVIGQAITRNRPASLRWKIELRHIQSDLAVAERSLIHELRPLFNIIHRQTLTSRESRLARLLLETIG